VKLSEKVGYKGMMLSDVPNMAAAIGYTNASWTLKCDLICEYVGRLLNHMDKVGMRQVTPRWRQAALPDRPFVDLTSGYVLRSVQDFPRQGDAPPWRLFQNYIRDVLMIRRGSLEDEAIEFSNPAPAQAPPEPEERLSA
jgi:monooxygenase